MIATSILGMSLVFLYQIQKRTVRISSETKKINVIVGLARSKMYDCRYDFRKRDFNKIFYSENGIFREESFNDFEWECISYPFSVSLKKLQALFQVKNIQNLNLNAESIIKKALINPFLKNFSSILKNSIREIVVIVSWKEGLGKERLKVVNSVIDRVPMSILSRNLYIITQKIKYFLQ